MVLASIYVGGPNGTRTHDVCNASAALFRLSERPLAAPIGATPQRRPRRRLTHQVGPPYAAAPSPTSAPPNPPTRFPTPFTLPTPAPATTPKPPPKSPSWKPTRSITAACRPACTGRRRRTRSNRQLASDLQEIRPGGIGTAGQCTSFITHSVAGARAAFRAACIPRRAWPPGR